MKKLTIHRMNSTGQPRCGVQNGYVSYSGADAVVSCPDCKGGGMNTDAIEQAAAHFRNKYGAEAVRHILPCGCHLISGRLVHLCITCELARTQRLGQAEAVD